jgi:hypothetical protein
MDHADLVAEPLDDLKNVGGQEDRAASLDELREQLLDLPRRDRINSLERLI